MTDHPAAGPLRMFIQRLVGTYRDIPDHSASRSRTLLTLILAETLLGERLMRSEARVSPLQVAVIGPTQAGKSTVVNLLLGIHKAESSPLAAFTRELNGFVQCRHGEDVGWIRGIFGDEHLRLEKVEHQAGPDAVVWDTPDFDSHRSHDYRTLIAKVGGLADVIVLVVSKEKYADLSVWETLDALRPLDRKLVVCLNKVSSDQEVLAEAVRERLRESEWDDEVPVVVLPYTPQKDAYQALSKIPEVALLRSTVLDSGHRCDEACRLIGLCAVIERNWQDWLNPVMAEINAANSWEREVGRRLNDAMATYEEQYLDHASHNDAFKQAVVQLLELLEIPALARPLTKDRNVLTWPLRRFTGLFDDDSQKSRGDAEATILNDVRDHALLSLHAVIVQGTDDPGQAGAWWRGLNRSYGGASESLKLGFIDAVKRYQADFEPEIEDAARSLYARLEENPLVLNTLRASRVAADTAGVIFAVKTGTVGVTDALLTPAMLSLTSMLTESAVGQYVESVRENLLDRQRALVRELFRKEVRDTLIDLPSRSSAAGLFLVDAEDLDRLERLKKEVCF